MHYLIDNYDSFTYNLYQLIGTQTSEEIKVVKNDAITVENLMKANPELTINTGVLKKVLSSFFININILFPFLIVNLSTLTFLL